MSSIAATPSLENRTIRLEKRMATYALAAGASLAVGADAAQAEVQCRFLNEEISVGVDDDPNIASLLIDVDGNGEADFELIVNAFDNDGSAETFVKIVGKEVASGQSTKDNKIKLDGESQGQKARPFGEGDLVGEEKPEDTGAFLDDRFDCFAGSPDRFVGVKLFLPDPENPGDFLEHVGFIRLCFIPATLESPARVLVGEAGFETEPFVAALIGCGFDVKLTGGGCQIGATGKLVDLAPLGLLALGAAGLAITRRRRREVAGQR